MKQNELVDYGFKGNIKSVVIKEHPGPTEGASGSWTAEKETTLIRTMVFDRSGMLENESFESPQTKYSRAYTNQGNKKISCVERGELEGSSTFSYTDSSMVERNLNKSGVLTFEAITVFDKNFLTIKEIYKYYRRDGQLTNTTETVFQNRIDGYFNKFVYTDKGSKEVTEYEYIILQRDERGNPLQALKKENGQPSSLKIFTYEYK
ncbi:hypothetical protein [Pseudochryseolinea flava]|uniref:hypothetical protein n=1 Tax=Pseudochryseolinea flava TaxID=2059302 RepID=UPI001058080F|nr:hypothetical protein [Pseudochryseolinea flava]